MLKIKEFIYRCEDERFFLENRGIFNLIEDYLNEIKEEDKFNNKKKDGDIFDKKIAFTIRKELIPPFDDDNYNKIKESSERLILEPIQIQEIKMEIPQTIYKPKYNFKERIKILFKGKI